MGSSEGRPEKGKSLLTKSHSNLGGKLSFIMQQQPLVQRPRIKSLPFLNEKPPTKDSSDDEDKEETIVRIDSLGDLWKSSRP